jgi:predicted nucleic acid-binding protein
MKRLRIVIDTNVLISAAVKPLGSQARYKPQMDLNDLAQPRRRMFMIY